MNYIYIMIGSSFTALSLTAWAFWYSHIGKGSVSRWPTVYAFFAAVALILLIAVPMYIQKDKYLLSVQYGLDLNPVSFTALTSFGIPSWREPLSEDSLRAVVSRSRECVIRGLKFFASKGYILSASDVFIADKVCDDTQVAQSQYSLIDDAAIERRAAIAPR